LRQEQNTVDESQRWTATAACLILALGAAITTAGVPGTAAESQPQQTAQSPNSGSDREEIKQLIDKYAKSVSDADTKLAAEVWWDSPEVSFIHPLGHEHGFEQIKQNVYERLMGGMFSERKLTPRDISVHVYGNSAWAEFYWDFVAKSREDGSPVTTHGRETQIYRRIDGRWRLVHVHYSGMPPTQRPAGNWAGREKRSRQKAVSSGKPLWKGGIAICLLPSAFCPLLSAFCRLPAAFCRLATRHYFFLGGCEGLISMRLARAVVGNLYRSITAFAMSSPVSFQVSCALAAGEPPKPVATLPGMM